MKKLLILAYDFPPYVSVGALRPYNWYRYLKEYGVVPVVVTRQWSNRSGNELDYIAAGESNQSITEETEYGILIRTPYQPSWSNRLLLKYGDKRFRLFRRALTAIDEIRQFITVSGPKKQLYYAAKQYLQKNKVDAVVATGEPFVLFYFAQKLSKEFNLPWIADYRDPWSQDKSRPSSPILEWWNSLIERKTITTCSGIITVSELCKQLITENTTDQPFYILPNGYDPEAMDKVAQIPQNDKQLSIAFAGTLYDWHPWKSFLTQVSAVLEQTATPIRLNLYGINKAEEVEEFLQKFPPKTRASVVITPKLSNKQLLHHLAGNSVMLLFNDYAIMGTKIYDYLGIRRKIILCYGNDAKALTLKEKYYNLEAVAGLSRQLQADLIKKTNSGIVVEDEAHLAIVLQDLLREFRAGNGIACNSVGVEEYSRKIQVKKLADLIKKM